MEPQETLVRNFIESMKGLAGPSRKQRTVAFQKMREFCLILNRSPDDLLDIVPGMMPEFSIWLEKQSLSGKTIAQYINLAKIILRDLGQEVKFSYRIPRDTVQEHKKKQAERWFGEDDISKIKNYVAKLKKAGNSYPGACTHMLMDTGARLGELANLKAKDVHENMAWISKSKTQPRLVFFSKLTAGYLSELDFFGSRFPETPVFGPETKISFAVNQVLEDLGMKKNGDGRGPHTFRHWFATYMLYYGKMEPEKVATIMGDTVGMVLGTYVHPTPTMLQFAYPEKFWLDGASGAFFT